MRSQASADSRGRQAGIRRPARRRRPRRRCTAGDVSTGGAWWFEAPCPLGVLPSEASPSVPLHFVEREGPESEIFQIRQGGIGYVPPLHEVERGPGGEASKGRTPTGQGIMERAPAAGATADASIPTAPAAAAPAPRSSRSSGPWPLADRRADRAAAGSGRGAGRPPGAR